MSFFTNQPKNGQYNLLNMSINVNTVTSGRHRKTEKERPPPAFVLPPPTHHPRPPRYSQACGIRSRPGYQLIGITSKH